jgi:uncharacterized protein YxjI
MSAPFVTSLRSRPGVITIGDVSGAHVLHLRVEMPEVWDTVRIDVSATEPVRAVKLHALEALRPGALFHDDYFIKLRGNEIFDETLSLKDAGALDGSIFLLTQKRRRPVR